jgi:sigma-E factor negative regulatory protein RseA
MNDALREQISALMDGELAADQSRFLLRRMDADPTLAKCWSRYQVAAQVLRHRQALLAPLPGNFAESVMTQVQRGDRSHFGMRILRWAGGGAIAAAVTVFALVSFRPGGPTPPATTGLAVMPATTLPARPAASATAETFMPIAPSFDYAQPASFDTGVFSMPRYDQRSPYEAAWHQHAQAPIVLLVAPRQTTAPSPTTAPPARQ